MFSRVFNTNYYCYFAITKKNNTIPILTNKMYKINCEDEKLEFLGKIQDIGFVIFVNQSAVIEGVSDNIGKYIPSVKPNQLIGQLLKETFFVDPVKKSLIIEAIKEIKENNVPIRLLKTIEINKKPYYLSISNSHDVINLEFEICIESNNGQTSTMNNKLIDLQSEEKNVWGILAEILSQHLKVDRVMVYEFNEDSSGVVVAESLRRPSLDSYLGLNYPEFDIPKQARDLYRVKHCRFIADIDQEYSQVLSAGNKEINLQEISIRRLSPVHLQYLKNAGFRSSISFSIMINGELWGLVCCQHEKPMHIDLSVRNFSLMLTNFAANKFQQLQDKQKMNYLEEVQELELLLKEKVLLKSDVFQELKNISNLLVKILDADGIAIGFEDSLFLDGLHPLKDVLRSQLSNISHLSTHHIFSTYSLSSASQIYNAFGKSIA